MSTLKSSDLITPFTDKITEKLLGQLNKFRNSQLVAASQSLALLGEFEFTGQIGDLYIMSAVQPASGESMTYDVLINGTSVLASPPFTLNSTTWNAGQISLWSLLNTASPFPTSFAAGAYVQVTRTYTAGGSPAMTVNSVVLEPSYHYYIGN